MDAPTDLFLSLTPERVLDAVEAAGVRCNPVCYPLNSYENRVYDVELEDREHLVAKFYRPGRWTEAQILEEHRYMADLEEAEVPICGLRPFPDGSTLRRVESIWYCLYDRRGGRAPEEVDDELAMRLGMLAGRIHNVGASREARHRLRLDPDTWIRRSVDWLQSHGQPPAPFGERYAAAALELAGLAEEALAGVSVHRVHGDFHLGNLLLREGRLHVLDFDDCCVGPAVQDMWLLLPAQGPDVGRLRESFLEGYERFRTFDRDQLRLVELLRAMRVVHYAAWLARRWHDPVFPATWPHVGEAGYWERETADLEELLRVVRRQGAGGEQATAAEEEGEELTNADFFWDWED